MYFRKSINLVADFFTSMNKEFQVKVTLASIVQISHKLMTFNLIIVNNFSFSYR